MGEQQQRDEVLLSMLVPVCLLLLL